jgi:N-acyl amino acid synthase of PEP-CTERM/exosortase system
MALRLARSDSTSDAHLYESYQKYFEAILADSPALIYAAQKIRYQVYCVERLFEDSTQFPGGAEKDEFDSHAVHTLLKHRPSGQHVGTVRLVLPLESDIGHSFALQNVTDKTLLANIPIPATGEVSRFSISREFRRRATDTVYGQADNGNESAAGAERRQGPLLRLGLIQGLVRMTVQNGITHWCAVMEPTLLRMLSGMAIRFEPIGPMVQYHGLRQPCICNVKNALLCVKREHPAFWEILTNCGELRL